MKTFILDLPVKTLHFPFQLLVKTLFLLLVKISIFDGKQFWIRITIVNLEIVLGISNLWSLNVNLPFPLSTNHKSNESFFFNSHV